MNVFIFCIKASAVETLYAQKYGKLVELSKQELIDCTSENLACDGNNLNILFRILVCDLSGVI